MSLTLVFLFLLLGGAAMLILGLRGRIVSRHPHCRKCRFDLVGIYPPAGHCPECGAELDKPHAVRNDRRIPIRGLVALGVIAVCIALLSTTAAFFAASGRLDWYRYMTTDWLRARAAAQQDGLCLLELHDRIVTGKLSQAQIDAIVATTLALQADRENHPYLNPRWGDVLQAAVLAGYVSDEDHQQFVKQSFRFEAHTRPLVHPNPDLPIELFAIADRGGWTLVYVDCLLKELRADGELANPATYVAPAGSERSANRGRIAYDTPSFVPLLLDVGTHEITTTWQISAFATPDEGATPITTWDFTSMTMLTVVPETQPIAALVKEQWVTDEFREELTIEQVAAIALPTGATLVTISLTCPSRVALAMDVVLIDADRTWLVGQLLVQRGYTTYPTTIERELTNFDLRQATLELRPNPRVAERTTDINEILGEGVSIPVNVEWQE